MRIISFSAKSRHGKDTCAALLRELAWERHGARVGTWALAHALKARVYGELKGEASFEDVFFTKPPAVRDRLQQAGTEEGRKVFGLELWTLQTEAYLRLLSDVADLDAVVLTDVRFPNEVTFAQQNGHVKDVGERGLTFYIVSDRPTLTGKAAEHESETALDAYDKSNFDGILINHQTTTLDDLREQLIPYVDALFGHKAAR